MKRIISKLRHYHSALGLRGVVAFLAGKLRGVTPVFTTRVEGIKHPVMVRLGTTDVSVLKQVLLEKHYNYRPVRDPKVIVDAGANIGLSAVFFANRYPDALIIALEPERSNFEMLVVNTSKYPGIRPVEGALWPTTSKLALLDPGAGSHGFQTSEVPAGGSVSGIEAFTVESLMSRFNVGHIDVLKIDIEGAEKEVFEHPLPWINKVDLIMAELHEHLKPGCNEAFNAATREFVPAGVIGETIIKTRSTSAS